MPSAWRRRAMAALPFAAHLLLPLVAFVRVWAVWTGEGAFFTGDTTGTYWPDLVYFQRALSEGTLPLWNPHDRGGYPFACDPQASILYPVDWLLAGLGSLLGGMPFALLQLKILLHLGIAGIAAHVFLRGLGVGRLPATLGGMAYQLGPYMLQNAHFSLIWPAAWVPLVLRAIDELAARPSWHASLALGLTGALVAHAGSPPTAFYGLLVAAPYLVVRAVQVRRVGRARAAALPALAGAGLAGLLALPQLLGTLKLTARSIRGEQGFDWLAQESVKPLELVGLVAPSGDPAFIFAGASVVLLAAVGLATSRRRVDGRLFGVVAAVGLLLALGSHTHLLRTLYSFVPGFGAFRLPFRYVYLLNVALPVLAAFGLEAVLDRRSSTSGALRTTGRVLAVAAGGLLLLRLAGGVVDDDRLLAELWLALVFAALVWAGLRFLATRHAPGGREAIPVLAVVALELATGAQETSVLADGDFEPTPEIAPQALARVQEDAERFRIYDEFGLNYRAGSRLGLRDLRGYLDPLRLSRYDEVLQALDDHPELAPLFNVKHVLHAPHPRLGFRHHRLRDPKRLEGAREVEEHVFELPDPAPRAFWVGGAEIVGSPSEALARLPHFDARRRALLAREDLSSRALRAVRKLGESRRPRRAAEILDTGPNHATFRVEAPSRGLVVFNEAWFPGWKATLDGEPVRVLRANHLVQAILVPEGTHRIAWRFEPSYFIAPAWAALVALLAFPTGLLVRRLRRRTARPGDGGEAPGSTGSARSTPPGRG